MKCVVNVTVAKKEHKQITLEEMLNRPGVYKNTLNSKSYIVVFKKFNNDVSAIFIDEDGRVESFSQSCWEHHKFYESNNEVELKISN